MSSLNSKIKMRFGENATTAWLVGINVAIWLLGLVASFFGAGWLIDWLEMPSGAGALLQRIWTPLTYMFTHESFWHLLFNMLWLWWFGQILLIRLTPAHLVGIYLGGGLAGALFYFIFYLVAPGHALLCGASAAVLALMTTAAVCNPDYSVRLFLIGNVKLKWLVGIMVLLAFLGLGGGNAGGESAHIGGALFGLLYGFSLRSGQDFVGRAVKYINNAHARGKKPKTSAGPAETRKRSGRKVVEAIEAHKRLDQLLDKVRISGYDSLTRAEKAELRKLSANL